MIVNKSWSRFWSWVARANPCGPCCGIVNGFGRVVLTEGADELSWIVKPEGDGSDGLDL